MTQLVLGLKLYHSIILYAVKNRKQSCCQFLHAVLTLVPATVFCDVCRQVGGDLTLQAYLQFQST